MKSNIFPALMLTFCCILLFAVVYPLAIFGIGKLAAPQAGRGETIELNGRTVGYSRIGQNFSEERYFWPRPSAVGYNAAGSAGSNKGPSNPDYLAVVQQRIDTFAVHHPYLRKADIPSEMVTASGSGLDPHISPRAAAVQVKRVADFRGLNEAIVAALVEKNTERPLLGLFGPPVVNVLTLNLALSNIN